jgi:integrase
MAVEAKPFDAGDQSVESILARHRLTKREEIAVRPFVEVVGKWKPESIEAAHVEAVIAAWRARGINHNSLRNYVQHMRQVLMRLSNYGLRKQCLAALPPPMKQQARTVTMSQEQFNHVLLFASAGMRLFLLLCHDSALRSETAARVSRQDYDSSTGCISLKSKGVAVTIPTTARTREVLNQLHHPTQAFIEQLMPKAYRGGRAINNLRAEWRRVLAAAGVDAKINLHDLRRSMARDVYLESKDIRVVQKLLGHSSPVVTWQYLEAVATPAELEPAMEAALKRNGDCK